MQFAKSKPANGLYKLIVNTNPKSSFSESYKILATNLSFKDINSDLHCIAITSPLPGEGKSTTAANLAITLAQGGKKVILVDADLRRPTLYKIFSCSGMFGLTNALVNGEDPLSICQRFVESNLRVLTAGPLPPNASELLGSKQMKAVLARLKGDADIVILDCPPTLGLNDTLTLAPSVDGFLLVVASGATPRMAIKQTMDQLNMVGAKMIGTILNGLDSKDRDFYY